MKHPFITTLIACGVIAISMLMNEAVFSVIKELRGPALTGFFLFITNIGVGITIALFAWLIVIRKKYSLFILGMLGALVSLALATFFKEIFQIPRPFDLIEPLTRSVTNLGFPSQHSAFLMAFMPHLLHPKGQRWLRWAGIFVIICVITSRVYLGLHTFGDVIAGSILGYVIGTFFHEEKKEKLITWAKEFEIRRQIAHLFIGLAIIWLYANMWLQAWHLSIILIAGFFASHLIRKRKILLFHKLLDWFERKEDRKKFPGKGAFFLVFGAFLSMILFSRLYALASIAIMTVGDSVATIIGIYIGKRAHPLNADKTVEGTIIGWVCASLVAMLFIPFPKAIIAGFAGMFVEALHIRIAGYKIDDNVIVPVVAGVVMKIL